MSDKPSKRSDETPLWLKVVGPWQWWLFPGSLIVVVILVLVFIDF